jgi:hypothetical protein
MPVWIFILSYFLVVILFCFSFDCFVFEMGSHYIVQAGLELLILLSQPPE